MKKPVIFFDLFDTLVSVDRGYLEPYFTREIDRMGDMGELLTAEDTIKELTYRSPYILQTYTLSEMAQYYENRMKESLLNVDANVLHMLQTLKAEGYRLCVISDAAMVDVMHWKESPLSALFDDTVFSYQEHVVKPDVELFQRAQLRMGSLGYSVFVGDGGHSELIGARESGMYTVKAEWTKNRREPEICEQADIRLQHPAQMVALMHMIEYEHDVGPMNDEPSIAEN